MRDPHVRLKFGNNLYDCKLLDVTDPDERAAQLGPRANENPPLFMCCLSEPSRLRSLRCP